MIRVALLATLALHLLATPARGAYNNAEVLQKSTESQIRNLLEPVIDKYCRDECRIMSVNVTVDIANQEHLAPGFDELEGTAAARLAPSSAQVKLLIDERVGPVTQTKLLEFIQQYLETMDYPVRVLTQTVRFPQPIGSSGKIAELREKVSKELKQKIDELFTAFCPKQCMLTDYSIRVDQVNVEEAEYGSPGEILQEGGLALRIKGINATILLDETLTPQERANIMEMAKLKTAYLKNVELASRVIKFPRPKGEEITEGGYVLGPDGKRLASTNAKSDSKSSESSDRKTTESKDSQNISKTNSNETNAKQERFERIEKIERVESGDAVQQELKKFQVYGLFFATAVLAMLVFITLSIFRVKLGGSGAGASVHKIIQQLTTDPTSSSAPSTYVSGGDSISPSQNDRNTVLARRYEIEKLVEELTALFSQNPRVAKQVFTRVLTEEGVETTAQYVYIFGESIVVDMLRDPSLQTDLNELLEFYARNTIELNDEEKLELLRKLHNRAIAGKLAVMGSRSSNQFEFLVEMDGLQILELVRAESITVKAIVVTQCDAQKRAAIFAQLDEDTRMKLLTELSRIDYLPRDFIANVAGALKRKRKENPKLNTEALPGSEVLVGLLERTGTDVQKSVIKMLEVSSPDSARLIKNKLVSIDTLKYLRDGQLLEIVLSLKHEELLQFLKGANPDIKGAIFSKAPKDLVVELDEELAQVSPPQRETYQTLERKVLNRMKIMANEGAINLIETNERMMGDQRAASGAAPTEGGSASQEQQAADGAMKKVAGW